MKSRREFMREAAFGAAGLAVDINAFSGPGLGNLDFSVFRKFMIGERVKGEFHVRAMCSQNNWDFERICGTGKQPGF